MKRDRALPFVGGHLLGDVLHGFATHSGNWIARGSGCASPTGHCRYFSQTAAPSRHGCCGRMRPVGCSGVLKERIGRSHGEASRAAPPIRDRRDGCMCARVHRTGPAGASREPGRSPERGCVSTGLRIATQRADRARRGDLACGTISGLRRAHQRLPARRRAAHSNQHCLWRYRHSCAAVWLSHLIAIFANPGFQEPLGPGRADGLRSIQSGPPRPFALRIR